jgi:acetyltransferase
MEQRREVERLSSLGEHTLSEHETKGLLALWGVPVTREKRVDTLEDACAAAMELGYPVALKVESPDVLHKTDAGLVELDVGGAADLRQAYDALLVNARHKHPGARISGVLVQEMVSGGTEVIVGVFRDPQFGPVLLLGMGGVLVELYRDVALRVCPITREDANEMLSEVRGARVLEGYRGIPPGDVEALIDTLIDVSTMAVHLRDSIRELDINPLTVLPRGQGVKALDALAVLGS